MLPSAKRLSRQQVALFLKNPEIKVVFNAVGTLKFLRPSNDAQPGFCVITSSKNQKKAVLRNKIRRQLYDLMEHFPEHPIIGMLYVSKNVYDMTHSDLKRHFYGLLEKTIKNHPGNS